MGCGTILAAKRIVLMAWGTGKAPIVNEAVTGPVNDIVSASYLQDHPNASFYIDKEAAGDLG
jgi:glucosamine-6-phosphate deaminase